MKAGVLHNERTIQDLTLQYAGRTNVFDGTSRVPEVEKDYEVLRIIVTAQQSDAVNFGIHERTFKLTP